jgi:hypothetical protein
MNRREFLSAVTGGRFAAPLAAAAQAAARLFRIGFLPMGRGQGRSTRRTGP